MFSMVLIALNSLSDPVLICYIILVYYCKSCILIGWYALHDNAYRKKHKQTKTSQSLTCTSSLTPRILQTKRRFTLDFYNHTWPLPLQDWSVFLNINNICYCKIGKTVSFMESQPTLLRTCHIPNVINHCWPFPVPI